MKDNPEIFDSVVIRATRNGFTVSSSINSMHEVESTPWCFESFDGLVGWLRQSIVRNDKAAESDE